MKLALEMTQDNMRLHPFYKPNAATVRELMAPWIAAWSRGKDSSSLVTWLEGLRRTGIISVNQPRLVESDTGIEFPFVRDETEAIRNILIRHQWDCKQVFPETREKLLCQIFGRGLPPVHPGMKKGRWCTRATKVDPMKRFRSTLAPADSSQELMVLTGVRWGESRNRDDKLKIAGCHAGGECGTQIDGENIASPIVNWTTCQIFDWLNGLVEKELRQALDDISTVTRRLTGIYSPDDWDGESLRFGCMGCSAVSNDKVLMHAKGRDPRYGFIMEIYDVWKELWKPPNRLVAIVVKRPKGKKPYPKAIRGPIRMEARKQYFGVLMDIQKRAGITLVTRDDETYIRECWRKQVYPKGWCAEDEAMTWDMLDRSEHAEYLAKHQMPLFCHGPRKSGV